MTKKEGMFYGVAVAFALTIAGAILQIFLRTPTAQEAAGGLAQKIFYFHTAASEGIYVSGAVCFGASALYLVVPSETANAWARAGSDCAALFGTLALCSGLFWTKKAAGVYWVWDPQPVTRLLSVQIYWAICVLRAFAGKGTAERRFAAALGVMGTVNLPIIYFSVQTWAGDRPSVIREGAGETGGSMRPAFILGQVALTLLLPPLLLLLRSRLFLVEAQMHHTWQEALTRGIVDRADELGADD